MRSFIRESVLIIVTGILSGCCMNAGTKPAGPATAAAADANAGVMTFGGSNVLRITVPAADKCVATEGFLKVTGPNVETELWLARDAQTVDAAIGRVPQQIDSEFKNIKLDGTTDITVAGSPAKRLTGSGNEADDGDPGHADVIVFKVGDHVFVACTHDEHLTDVYRQTMFTLVQTAQIP